MKITCGSCAAKYTVSDDKVQGKTVKVKCRKCGAVIVVSSTGEVQTTGGSLGNGAGDEASYTVSVSDTDQRTMTTSEIVTAYNDGIIDAETFIWAEGMADWQPLKDVDTIVDALHVAAEAAEAAEAEPDPEPEAPDLSSTVAMPEGAMAGLDFSALSQPAAQPDADDFGAATVAMPTNAFEAAMANAPAAVRAAASAVGTSSSSSLSSSSGGGSGGSFAASTSTAASRPKTEENSAIFSLNMLTSKAGNEDAPPPSSNSLTEDSGLIDLKALAAGMGGDPGGIAAAPAGDGMFPLGAPPPTAPVAVSEPPPAAAASNRNLIIGLGAAVVVLFAALVFFVVRGSGDETKAAATPTATPTAVATPTATETAAPEPTAEPSATASASASASAAAPKVAAGPRPKAVPRPGGAAAGPRPAPQPKPAPKPTTGKCGCKPDDLMCQMRCATK